MRPPPRGAATPTSRESVARGGVSDADGDGRARWMDAMLYLSRIFGLNVGGGGWWFVGCCCCFCFEDDGYSWQVDFFLELMLGYCAALGVSTCSLSLIIF